MSMLIYQAEATWKQQIYGSASLAVFTGELILLFLSGQCL